MEAVDGASDGSNVVAVEDECVVEVVGKVAVLEVLDLVQAQRHQAAECVQRRQLHTLYDTTRTGRRQTLITSCYGTVARSRIAVPLQIKLGKSTDRGQFWACTEFWDPLKSAHSGHLNRFSRFAGLTLVTMHTQTDDATRCATIGRIL